MITVGVIGCGYWGPNIIRNLYGNHKCFLKTCCDINPERLSLIEHKYPNVKLTTHSGEIIKDKDIDAVFIATPISSHYALAREALKAWKDVFVEKPLAGSVKESGELLELANKAGRILMVGHVFRYAPSVIKIKELIEKGVIGKMYYISCTRVNLGIHRSDASVIWDLASHDLYNMFYWLEDEPISISARGSAFVMKNIPDVAFISMRFPKGTLANIHVSWLAPSKLRDTTIVGSKKMIVYNDLEPSEKLKIFDKGVSVLEPKNFGEFQLSYRAGDVVVPRLESVEPLSEEINHFLYCIKTRETPKTDGLSSLKVVKYLELAEESLQNNLA